MMYILWKISVKYQLHVSNDMNDCHRKILVCPPYYMIPQPRKNIFYK